jgi:intein/homing endonuclease
LSEKYDEEIIEWLRRSREQVGELEPVYQTPDGDIIDGKHRLMAFPGWKTQVVQVEDLRKVVERIHRNVHRKMGKDEIKQAILQLAVIYDKSGVPVELIVDKIKEVLPFSESYIRKLLPAKYKRERKIKEKPAVKLLEEKPTPTAPTPPTPKPAETKYMTCPVCLPPETIVGGVFKEIESVASGVFVESLAGLARTQETYSRPYSGLLYVIKGEGFLPLEVTPEHPVLISDGHGMFAWKTPAELIEKHSYRYGHYLVMPKPPSIFDFGEINLSAFVKERRSEKYLEAIRLREEHGWGATRIARAIEVPFRTVCNWIYSKQTPKEISYKIPLNKDVAWLLGLYVAEGTHGSKGVAFALGKKETFLADKVAKIGKELGYSPCVMEKPTSLWVELPSRVLARAFPTIMGDRAHRKRIPHFIFYHKNDEIIKSFLEGYVAGDGFPILRENKEHLCITTVSKVLALQLQQLYSRMNVFATIFKRRGSSVILGRMVNSRNQYLVRASTAKISENPRRAVKLSGDKVLVPIRKITTKNYEGTVYNLRTSDETYVASNLVVHNCGSKLVLKGDVLLPA